MISAIVFVPDAKRRELSRERELLVRSLVWLVSAVVAGVVRDVTLAAPAILELSDIAEDSGCVIVEADTEGERLTKAVAMSRYPRLLMIESAYHPADSMIGELDSIARVIAPDASAELLAAPATVWQRLFPDQARAIGLFAPASRCRSLPGRDFQRLKAGLRPKTRFTTRANPMF